MTKAEEFALKEFPVKRGLVCDPELGTLETDINKHQRRFAIKVYEQAEKDIKAELLEWAKMARQIAGQIPTDYMMGHHAAFVHLINKLESL